MLCTDEFFHSGFNRKPGVVEYFELDHHTRGISGVISTSSEQSIAVSYALHQQRGYVYAVELNHGSKAVNTSVRGASSLLFPLKTATTEEATLQNEKHQDASKIYRSPNTSKSSLAKRAFPSISTTQCSLCMTPNALFICHSAVSIYPFCPAGSQ